MQMLCSPVVTSHFYDLASQAVRMLSDQVLPPDIGGEGQAQAIGSVLLDLAWRNAFEPIEASCDGVLAMPLPPEATSVALPRIAISLRDTNGLAAGVSQGNQIHVAHVELRRQPSNSTRVDWNDANGTLDQPWCVRELVPWLGCAPTPSLCASTASLRGRTVAAAGPPTARAGVVVLDELFLEVDDDGVGGNELCAGDYELRVGLREWFGGYDVHTPAVRGMHSPMWNVSASSAALGVEEIALVVDVRLVQSINHTSVRTSSWQVDLPAYFNVSAMTRTSSTVHYQQEVRLRSVSTFVTTNTTTVGFEWGRDMNITNESSPNFLDGFVRPRGLPEHTLTPVWPSNTSDPIYETETSTHTRPPAHLISFIKAPPRDAVHLRTPFEVSLRLTTEAGFSLSGEQIQAILLAPLGSGAVLAPGAHGYTDAAGVATFNITIDAGLSGDYLLLFGSAGTMQAEPRNDVGAVIGAITDVLSLWRRFVDPILCSGFWFKRYGST